MSQRLLKENQAGQNDSLKNSQQKVEVGGVQRGIDHVCLNKRLQELSTMIGFLFRGDYLMSCPHEEVVLNQYDYVCFEIIRFIRDK